MNYLSKEERNITNLNFFILRLGYRVTATVKGTGILTIGNPSQLGAYLIFR